MKTLFIAAITFGASLFASADFGKEIDWKPFAETIQGTYTIVAVNGVAPEPAQKEGFVVIESDLAYFRFPLCHGACYFGEVEFEYNKTKAYRKDVSASHSIVTMELTKDGSMSRYQWENNNGKKIFRTFEFKLTSGDTLFVEHEIQ